MQTVTTREHSQSSTGEEIQSLHKLIAFQGLPSALTDFFLKSAQKRVFKKGDLLWQQDDAAASFVIVLDGVIELLATYKTMKSQLLGVFGPGDVIGLSDLIKHGRHQTTAKISSRYATVLLVPLKPDESPFETPLKLEFKNWVVKQLLVHEQILKDKIFILSAGRLHNKLVVLFKSLITRFAKNASGSVIVLPLSMTKTQIAKLVDSRVETVIRALNKWERADYIEINSDQLRLKNFDKLKKSAQNLISE